MESSSMAEALIPRFELEKTLNQGTIDQFLITVSILT